MRRMTGGTFAFLDRLMHLVIGFATSAKSGMTGATEALLAVFEQHWLSRNMHRMAAVTVELGHRGMNVFPLEGLGIMAGEAFFVRTLLCVTPGTVACPERFMGIGKQ